MQRTRHLFTLLATACLFASGCVSNPSTGGKSVGVGGMEGEKKTVQKNHQEIAARLYAGTPRTPPQFSDDPVPSGFALYK